MSGEPTTGVRGGRPHIANTRLTTAEQAELDRKRGDLPVAVAIRLAITAWPGLLPVEGDPLA